MRVAEPWGLVRQNRGGGSNAGWPENNDIQVPYRGFPVGEFVADMIVEGVIVEIKASQGIAKAHEVALVNYLVATGSEVGLLLNFGAASLQIRRKVRSLEAVGGPRYFFLTGII